MTMTADSMISDSLRGNDFLHRHDPVAFATLVARCTDEYVIATDYFNRPVDHPIHVISGDTADGTWCVRMIGAP